MRPRPRGVGVAVAGKESERRGESEQGADRRCGVGGGMALAGKESERRGRGIFLKIFFKCVTVNFRKCVTVK